jgi:anti-sigma B factor antagonist
MDIGVKNESGVLILTLQGDLMGGPEIESFHNLILEAIEKEQIHVVADLSQVHWMNSSGLGMLIRGMISLRSSSGDLRLANISERLQRPLEITRMDKVFQQYNSVAEAVTSFK